jgi:serine/threonine protein kinase
MSTSIQASTPSFLTPALARPVAELANVVEGLYSAISFSAAQDLTLSILRSFKDTDGLPEDCYGEYGRSCGGEANALELELAISENGKALVQQWFPGDYEYVRKLQDAERNQGRVDLMKSLRGGSFVAVKRMPLDWMTNGPEEFRDRHPCASERPWMDITLVGYLCARQYDYVCPVHGVFAEGATSYVVSTLATMGDLFDFCNKGSSIAREREDMLRPVAAQMLTAVRQLHNLGIVHRDLSMENILLTKESDGVLRVKLVDFGMSSIRRVHCSKYIGKQYCRAPEQYTGGSYDAVLVDDFTMGVLLFILASQEYLWLSTQPGKCTRFEYARQHGLREFLRLRKPRKVEGETMLEAFSPDFIDLVEGLVMLRPESRLCLGEDCFASGLRKSALDARWFRPSDEKVEATDEHPTTHAEPPMSPDEKPMDI